MFARDGKGASDDPYNFDIAADDRRYGVDTKTSSGNSQTKLGSSKLSRGGSGDAGLREQPKVRGTKSSSGDRDDGKHTNRSLNSGLRVALPSDAIDHVGSSMATSSTQHIIPASETTSFRASAPAGIPSALDKAMGFLNKYKEGGSVRNSDASTPTTTANTPIGAFRHSSGRVNKVRDKPNNGYEDDDDIDISLSSEDAGIGVTTQKKLMTTSELVSGLPKRVDPDVDVVVAGVESTFRRRNDELKVSDPQEKEHGMVATSRSLTGIRSSAPFLTARDLGIRVDEGLGKCVTAPKAAVSPIGLGRNINPALSMVNSSIKEYTEATKTSSGLRLSMNIPGSPRSDALKDRGKGHRSTNEGDSHDASNVGSSGSRARSNSRGTMFQELDTTSDQRSLGTSFSGVESICEINAEGSSSLVSPTVDQITTTNCLPVKLLPTDRESSPEGGSPFRRDQSLGRCGHPGSGGTMGNVVSFNDLAAITGHLAVPAADTVKSAISGGKGGGAQVFQKEKEKEEKEEHDDDGDDDYEDDDFEELEATIESGDCSGSLPGQAKSNGKLSDSTNGIRDIMLLTMAIQPSTIQTAPEDGYDSPMDDRGQGTNKRDPSQAWNEPADDSIIRRPHLSSEKVDRGIRPDQNVSRSANSPTYIRTSPSRKIANEVHDGDGDASGEETKAAWSVPFIDRSRRGGQCHVDFENRTARTVATMTNASVNNQMSKEHNSLARIKGPEKSRAPVSRGRETTSNCGTNITVLTNEGVVIDRSSEVRLPDRPPGASAVKTVARAETVAIVEYAHDPDRGVDLRSCGTQAVGSVAAVQANISVPGMIGTHSALDTDLLRARDGAWTAGVGYRPGEAYAKWGRFPCETPTYHNRPGLDFPNIAVSRVPAWPSMGAAATGGAAEEGDTVAADTGKKDDDGNGQGGPTKGPAPEVPNTDGQGVEQWYPETSERRSLGSTPAYLQEFLKAIAESQAESCAAWQRVIEQTARTPGPTVFLESCQPVEQRHAASVRGNGEVLLGSRIEGTERVSLERGRRAVDLGTIDAMTATQETLRKQLADMRENLARIRCRAEVTGFHHRYAYNYDSITDAQEFFNFTRPPATSQVEALMRVDPSLTPGQVAAAVKREDAAPPRATEPSPRQSESVNGDIPTVNQGPH